MSKESVIKEGLNYNVKTGFIVERSVDIDTNLFTYSTFVDKEHNLGGYTLQAMKNIHNDPELMQEMKSILDEIAIRFMALHDFINKNK